jgi:hypothetical protein
VKTLRAEHADAMKEQSAIALLSATLGFLRRNKIPRHVVLESVKQNYGPNRSSSSLRRYRRLVRSYEEMGLVMATWFSLPRFLDQESRPAPLALTGGRKSVAALVRASRVSISPATAIKFMLRSPSVKVLESNDVIALRPEFVLPNFEIPRAALVVERYLDTLSRNSSTSKRRTILLLERNCHVPEVNLRNIKPILRDVKGRGVAFMKAVDGDIESRRSRGTKPRRVGEMSVHIFAWTRHSRSRKPSAAKN